MVDLQFGTLGSTARISNNEAPAVPPPLPTPPPQEHNVPEGDCRSLGAIVLFVLYLVYSFVFLYLFLLLLFLLLVYHLFSRPSREDNSRKQHGDQRPIRLSRERLRSGTLSCLPSTTTLEVASCPPLEHRGETDLRDLSESFRSGSDIEAQKETPLTSQAKGSDSAPRQLLDHNLCPHAGEGAA